MSVLPSPIPHPLSFIDAPGWVKEMLEWVIGMEWPEGNEETTWDLADKWYRAGDELETLLADAERAALSSVTAFGGADGAVGAAIKQAWETIGSGKEESALDAACFLSHAIGEMVEGAGCDIQGAKIEFYIELGLLVIELIGLAVAAFFTFGAASAAAGPLCMATRFAIQQIIKRLLKSLVERGVKHAVRTGVRELGQNFGRKLGRFAVRAGREALDEGFEELAMQGGIQAYQQGIGRRDGFDLEALATAGLAGAAGGAASTLAGGHTGSFGSKLMHGGRAEILGELGGSLATGQLPSLENLGMAATSGARSSGVHHGSHEFNAMTGNILGNMAALSLDSSNVSAAAAPAAVAAPAGTATAAPVGTATAAPLVTAQAPPPLVAAATGDGSLHLAGVAGPEAPTAPVAGAGTPPGLSTAAPPTQAVPTPPAGGPIVSTLAGATPTISPVVSPSLTPPSASVPPTSTGAPPVSPTSVPSTTSPPAPGQTSPGQTSPAQPAGGQPAGGQPAGGTRQSGPVQVPSTQAPAMSTPLTSLAPATTSTSTPSPTTAPVTAAAQTAASHTQIPAVPTTSASQPVPTVHAAPAQTTPPVQATLAAQTAAPAPPTAPVTQTAPAVQTATPAAPTTTPQATTAPAPASPSSLPSPTQSIPNQPSPTQSIPNQSSPSPAAQSPSPGQTTQPTGQGSQPATPTQTRPVTPAAPAFTAPVTPAPATMPAPTATPTPTTPTPAAPTPATQAPVTQAPVAQTPATPTQATPTPTAQTPATPTQATPTPAAQTPATPTSATPTQGTQTQAAPGATAPTGTTTPTGTTPTPATPTPQAPAATPGQPGAQASSAVGQQQQSPPVMMPVVLVQASSGNGPARTEARSASESYHDGLRRQRRAVLQALLGRRDLAAAAWDALNRHEGADFTVGGVTTDETSALTGTDQPPSVNSSRRYHERGGYRPVLAQHQLDIENAVARDANGRPVRFPPLSSGWLRYSNDGGPQADPTRAVNCVDVVLSAADTWLHGRPRCAAARTFDGYATGHPDVPLGAEPNGAHRIENYFGTAFQRLCPDTTGMDPAQAGRQVDSSYARLVQQLQQAGPGAMAVVIHQSSDGATHTWPVFNDNGTVMFADPQQTPGSPSPTPPFTDGVIAMDVIVVGPDATPAPIEGLETGSWSQYRDGTGEVADPGGVPFDFERFIADPRWAAESTEFEQRLGAHFFNDPAALAAARLSVSRMREVLLTLTPRLDPAETDEDFARRVEGTFFRDDAAARSSAGQVGRGVTVDDLLAHGNLRELMTAFYNAAYVNSAADTLKLAILSVIDDARWSEAQSAGLDVELLQAMEIQLDESWNRAVLGRFAPVQFGRDPFGSGNVGMLSDHAFADMLEVMASQRRRRNRTEAELADLVSTPGDYAALGTPLGRFERAFIESFAGPLSDDTALPWREGATLHDTTNRWTARMTQQGFPVVDGISMTAARMLTAARALGLDPQQQQDFLNALMGWMLPCQDHSLLEILRGGQIAGIDRLTTGPASGDYGPVDLYRDLTGLELQTLRSAVAVDGMLPHEARYLAHAVDPNGFTETQHKVQDIVNRIWPQLSTGRVTDDDVAKWLSRNGIDPSDEAAVRAVAQRLSPAHVMAMTVYTRHSHYLINNVTRTHLFTGGRVEPVVRRMFDRKIAELVNNYLNKLAEGETPLPLPLLLRTVLHTGDGHLDSASPLSDLAAQWIDAARREAAPEWADAPLEELFETPERAGATPDLTQRQAWQRIQERLDELAPRLFDEMRWHADMVHDALTQLPAVGSEEDPTLAYRGDWMPPVWSPIYGSPYIATGGRAREFLSVSRLLDVAVRFMSENPARGGAGRVIVVYRLTGQHAHDVSVFSSFPEDLEAVMPPGSRTRRVRDPELAEMVRLALPEEYRDHCEVIVMEEI